MAMHVQIPADIHCFVQLLIRLIGAPLGPMKAFKLKENGMVDVWFVPCHGMASIVKASAQLVRGAKYICVGSPRRVYLYVEVKQPGAHWWLFGDDDYLRVGLEPAWQYDGESHIAIDFDVAAGEATMRDVETERDFNCTMAIPYYRFLHGDRERAIAEAKAEIAAFERRQAEAEAAAE